ncbi:MAG: AmmeMemoRadiSam system protein B [Anaerolineae bacterium]
MKPKLRELEIRPIQYQGQPMVLLRDPLKLSEAILAIPQPLAPVLALMDGTRDEAGLEAALQIRTGVRLAPGLLSKLVTDLDQAYLLDNERFAQAKSEALRAYREAPFRPLTTLDGSGAASDPDQAAAQLQSHIDALLPPASEPTNSASVRGLITPHIDYQRGGSVYGEVWRVAAQAAREAELVILLGTDHQGTDRTLTLTLQSYATPWGILPTDQPSVQALAAALGEEAAFAHELHHRSEHSIELAAVWLHFIRDRQPVPLVPILCGSFASFIAGQDDPAKYEPFVVALEILRELMKTRRTLVVAAADLAHMGPAFGDRYGLDFVARAQLRNADERLLATIYAGDATAFFAQLKAEGDRRHICGLPPIYLALRLLEPAQGEPAGYAICPADPQGLSFVSIAGVILR